MEPYQIGFKNTEGLKSGAFWFYYRFGFVPESETLRKIAEEEFNRIKTASSYRTSLKVLKALSVDNMQLTLDSCLLYTSPSPRDRTRSRMPSSA